MSKISEALLLIYLIYILFFCDLKTEQSSFLLHFYIGIAFATSHAVCSLCDWETPFCAGRLSIYPAITNRIVPLISETWLSVEHFPPLFCLLEAKFVCLLLLNMEYGMQ